MSNLPCACCGHMAESDKRRANFYNTNFIPNGWRLDYVELPQWQELILTGYCRDCHGKLEEKIPLPEGLAGDDLLKAIYDAMQNAHPYDDFSKHSGYYGRSKERSDFYNSRDDQSQIERSREFLSLFYDYDRAQVIDWLERNFPPQAHSEVLRDTGGSLFSRVVRIAREAGDLEKADSILDYILPRRDESGIHEGVEITSYEFDFAPIINFGGSEGIYVDCYLKGKFDESGRHSLHVGSLKTLDTGLDACKIMGELCGALMYHESQYVNRNLHRYTPDKMLKAEETRKNGQ